MYVKRKFLMRGGKGVYRAMVLSRLCLARGVHEGGGDREAGLKIVDILKHRL